MMPMVPPAINALCQAAENGFFRRTHKIRWIKSGAAPLAPELARRMNDLTGIIVTQGYGMTEASPVTHVGYITPEANRPASIGKPLAFTECRIVDSNGNDVAPGESGELAMRGPQFMLGYWKDPQATAAALRDGWYFSGDVVRRDDDGYYYVLDRSKEMIKYKGFPVAPAEVEIAFTRTSSCARLRRRSQTRSYRRRDSLCVCRAPPGLLRLLMHWIRNSANSLPIAWLRP